MFCRQCNQDKSPTDFYYHKSGKLKGKPQSYCKVCNNERQNQWSKDNRQRKADLNRGWRKRNSERRKVMVAASNALWKAIRNGSLHRGHTCAFCDSKENIEAAHTDYGKPLEVIWLCRPCHRLWDHIIPKTKI